MHHCTIKSEIWIENWSKNFFESSRPITLLSCISIWEGSEAPNARRGRPIEMTFLRENLILVFENLTIINIINIIEYIKNN